MLDKFMDAQRKADEVKQRLETIMVEGEASNGLVKVTANGNRIIKDIVIADALMTPERKEELQDLILIACEKALQQAENVSQAEMMKLMGGMNLGNLFGKS
ncbi:MAG: YbaB/EbfC family nucleoid-associated protein [Bacteroidota bacterium]|jgi:DNA-binding YbaB/EbfC family protein|nr:YbaB/EbfC family nucleoid-associated protein [Sphingobacteriales bacterium]